MINTPIWAVRGKIILEWIRCHDPKTTFSECWVLAQKWGEAKHWCLLHNRVSAWSSDQGQWGGEWRVDWEKALLSPGVQQSWGPRPTLCAAPQHREPVASLLCRCRSACLGGGYLKMQVNEVLFCFLPLTRNHLQIFWPPGSYFQGWHRGCQDEVSYSALSHWKPSATGRLSLLTGDIW